MDPYRSANLHRAKAMTEEEERDAVDRVARTWIGTPYHDHGEVKGGGVDCAKLLKCVYVEAGKIPADFRIKHYAPQFFLHQEEEQYIGYVLACGAHEIDQESARHGDIVVYKVGKCYAHGAIILKPGWPHIIHAHYAARLVLEAKGTAVHLGTPILGTKFFSMWG